MSACALEPDESCRVFGRVCPPSVDVAGFPNWFCWHPRHYSDASGSSMFSSTGHSCNFFFFCFSLLSGCAEVSHGGLIDISLVTNETEHFFMVYWPFVCLNFSFI